MTMFTKIEEIHTPDHCYLQNSDQCYFHGEYTPREGYTFSDTNNLIINLKKDMDRKGRPEWRYKEQAISNAAAIFRNGLKIEWLKQATLIPTPPSKRKNDPLYDDRILQILLRIAPHENLDIREFIVQSVDRESMHLAQQRYNPSELEMMYALDESLVNPNPRYLAVFDDVLTNGTHFRAISSILNKRFVGIPVVGFFIARVSRPSPEVVFGDFLNDLLSK